MKLLFKALKQNLKIKTFVGTSPNAVKIQMWSALIAMLLLHYLQLKSNFGWSLSNLVALLRMNLFTYRDLWAWLDEPLAYLCRVRLHTTKRLWRFNNSDSSMGA